MSGAGSEILRKLSELEAKIDQLIASQSRGPGIYSEKKSLPIRASYNTQAAPEKDLDGPYGNPKIQKDPPKWVGTSYAGKRYSEASMEYLLAMATYLEYMAKRSDENGYTTADGKPKSDYQLLDAARARGWAARK